MCVCIYIQWMHTHTHIYMQWQPTPVLLPGKSHGWRSLVGCSPWGRKESERLSDFTFTFHFHALEKEMATHSSVLAWRIPGMGEPGGLPSMGSHRVRHDWSNLAAAAAYITSSYPFICCWTFRLFPCLICSFLEQCTPSDQHGEKTRPSVPNLT